MKRNILVVFMLVMFSALIFPEVVVKKDGTILVGKIIKISSSSIKMELSDGDTIEVDKKNVSKVYIDEQEYYDENYGNNTTDEKKKEKGIEEARKSREERIKEAETKELLSKRFKELRNAGVGLIIPGAILSLAPAAFATAPIVNALLFSKDIYGTNSAFQSPLFTFGFSWYVALISIGVIFDVSAIVCFALAGGEYQKLQEKSKVSFKIGADKNKTTFALGCRL